MVIMTTIMILLKEEVSSSGETGLVLESVTPLAANVDIVVIEECLKMMGSLEGIHSAANVDTVAIEEYSKMMESLEGIHSAANVDTVAIEEYSKMMESLEGIHSAANVDTVAIEEYSKMMESLEGIHSAANVDTVAIEEYSKMMESSEDALWLNQEDKWRLFLLYDYKILLTYLNFLNYFVWLDKCLFYLSYTANIRIECWLKFGFWYKDHLRRPIWWFS